MISFAVKKGIVPCHDSGSLYEGSLPFEVSKIISSLTEGERSNISQSEG